MAKIGFAAVRLSASLDSSNWYCLQRYGRPLFVPARKILVQLALVPLLLFYSPHASKAQNLQPVMIVGTDYSTLKSFWASGFLSPRSYEEAGEIQAEADNSEPNTFMGDPFLGGIRVSYNKIYLIKSDIIIQLDLKKIQIVPSSKQEDDTSVGYIFTFEGATRGGKVISSTVSAGIFGPLCNNQEITYISIYPSGIRRASNAYRVDRYISPSGTEDFGGVLNVEFYTQSSVFSLWRGNIDMACLIIPFQETPSA